MNCWKCGKETEDGVLECEDCCQVTVTHNNARPNVQMIPINFDKIESVEDLVDVLREMGMWVAKGTEAHKRMRKFTDE